MAAVRDFITQHYRHFNAAALVDAAKAWEAHLGKGGKMLLTMAGAMSTAEMGLVIAELIRKDKIHGISLTGANLEEDVFNLVAHNSYRRVPNYRELRPEDEKALLDKGLNRVTDTCIPEHEAMRKIEKKMLALWERAQEKNERCFPHEYFYQLLRSKDLEPEYEIDPKGSWLLAAAEKSLPLFVPGWEDSTLGNRTSPGHLTPTQPKTFVPGHPAQNSDLGLDGTGGCSNSAGVRLEFRNFAKITGGETCNPDPSVVSWLALAPSWSILRSPPTTTA